MKRIAPPRRLQPLALACLALTAGAAQAQLNPAQTVEIIGSTPLSGAGVPKDLIPSNVQGASAAELERSHASDLSSFVSRKLGSVHLNEVQNNPFQADVNYRGFTASPLLGNAQGLSVYLDGMRLNQPFGDVVSWDLIPRAAIGSVTLMPGSNPLFGLNTLGGALSVQTKDGQRNPGTSLQLTAGQHQRASLEFEAGGSAAGTHWYVTGNRFHDGGWRAASPTDVSQLFGKIGLRRADTDIALSAAFAHNDLTGNGLQETRLLERDRASVYSYPDETHNRAASLNLSATQRLHADLSFSGVAYWRKIKTSTLNGDVNDDALDQALLQPGAAEIAALRAAGYSGFPTSGATTANTPFPKWRCIGNALLNDEPAEKCNGVLNSTRTDQSNHGLSGQFSWSGQLGGNRNLFIAGGAIDVSRVDFSQSSELGYLTPDHGVTGVGAFGDGGVTGGDVDGEPYDTRVELSSRTRTVSLFATDTLVLGPRTALTLSARWNRTTVKNRDAITPGGGPGSLDGDHRFSRVNPAVGLTFAPFSGVTGYAGYSQGSRAPSAIELGCADPENPCKLPNAMASDPPLRQVVAQTLEAGLRGGSGDTRWNLGVFRTTNKDDILFVADDALGFGYFRNFGKTRRQGVEAGFSTRVGNATLGANYTFLDATYRSPEAVDGSSNSSNSENEDEGLPGVDGQIQIHPGDRIPLTPRHMLKLFADWQLGQQWSVGADLTAIGGSLARGNENGRHEPDGTYYLGSGRSGGYAVLNLSIDYKPTAALKLFAQVNNLFDRRYSTAAQLGAAAFDANGNFVARPFPANAEGDRPLVHSTFYAPGAPRTVWVGLRWQFGE